ncbi:MAG: DUF1259 domain-containing protein [Acidobacteria bacterium]|nr:DUF1259 domain-containing protein [Acidobacteriota bacterium]
MHKLVSISIVFAGLTYAGVSIQQRQAIEQVVGVKGAYTEAEDVFRVAFPRADVPVTVEGRAMHPFLGFTSWAAFTSHGNGLMVMGDIVLLEDEVSPAMSAALDNNLEVTALHNHFFFEKPRVMYMHIGGHGQPEQLAGAVRRVLGAVRGVREKQPAPAADFGGPAIPAQNSIDSTALDAILATKGEVNNGMYKATIGRPAKMHGTAIGKQMGVNTWAAFAGANDRALVDGDFAMVKDELQGVLKSLRKSGIHIVAIHNHMTQEEPQYIFLHYWGTGRAADLAKAVKAAMDSQGR